MQFIEAVDFVDIIKPEQLIAGRVVQVNTTDMLMDVIIYEYDTIVKNVPVQMLYSSMSTNSAVIIVPRVGDDIYLTNRQGILTHIGYVNTYGKEGKNYIRSLWSIMNESGEILEDNENFVERGMKVIQLDEGDIGFFIHEKDRMLEFVMKRDGRILLSFGAGVIILNQDEVSERKLLNLMKSNDLNGHVVEWGIPEVRIANLLQKLYNEFRFLILGNFEDVCIGYNDNNGLPLLDREQSEVRLRLKIGSCELLISKTGNIELKTSGKLYIKGSDNECNLLNTNIAVNNLHMTVNKDSKQEIKGKCDININNKLTIEVGNDIVIKGNAIKIEGSSLEVSASRIKLAGEKGFVLEDILPLLLSHTHIDSKGGTTSPSAQLGNILMMKSQIVKGM